MLIIYHFFVFLTKTQKQVAVNETFFSITRCVWGKNMRKKASRPDLKAVQDTGIS